MKKAIKAFVYGLEKESDILKRSESILIKSRGKYQIDLSKEVITNYEILWKLIF